MSELVLPGLDGSNPLGFFAALGVLDAIDQHAKQRHETRPSLSWSESGYLAVLKWDGSESVFDILDRSLRTPEVEEILAFRHLKIEKNGPKVTGSLAVQRAILRRWIERTIEARMWTGVHMSACLMCEAVCGEDKDSPTAAQLSSAGVDFATDIPLSHVVQQTPFDFSSRNTQFLDQLRIIRTQVDRASIESALMGTSVPASEGRTMNWDPLFEMPGALFGGRGPSFYPVLEWFMFRGLRFCPVIPTTQGAMVAGMRGRRKAGTLRWPLWSPSIGADLISSVLSLDHYVTDAQQSPARRGIFARFESRFMKAADGYDGTFSPSTPV